MKWLQLVLAFIATSRYNLQSLTIGCPPDLHHMYPGSTWLPRNDQRVQSRVWASQHLVQHYGHARPRGAEYFKVRLLDPTVLFHATLLARVTSESILPQYYFAVCVYLFVASSRFLFRGDRQKRRSLILHQFCFGNRMLVTPTRENAEAGSRPRGSGVTGTTHGSSTKTTSTFRSLLGIYREYLI